MKGDVQIKRPANIALYTILVIVCLTILVSFREHGASFLHGTTFVTYVHLPQRCSENKSVNSNETRKTNVAFLKVHKAGSCTVQNLLFRFGIRHHLNILLPKTGHYLHGEEQKLPLKRGEHYNIFACHTIYRKQLFDSLLPADSVTIGIVREPVSRLISAAHYYRDVMNSEYLKKIQRENFVHNLVNFPGKYDSNFFSHTRNTMGHDFGFAKSIEQTDKVKIGQYLAELNSQFLLVLITEKFDESLIMLKRLLDWSTQDIIYLKSNTHVHNSINLNETERTRFRKTSFLDFEVYEYFLNVFEMKLEQMDSDFHDEVLFFKNVLYNVREFCEMQRKNNTLVIGQSKWNNEFEVTETECKLMQTESLDFVHKIRQRQL